jgi:hypothetical protein
MLSCGVASWGSQLRTWTLAWKRRRASQIQVVAALASIAVGGVVMITFEHLTKLYRDNLAGPTLRPSNT